MAVKERELHPASPRHRRSPPPRRDAATVVAAAVASVAMAVAVAAVAFAVHALSDSRSRLRQAGGVTAGGSTASAASPATVTPLGVTLQTFTITPSQPSVPAGPVDLTVTNGAPIGHELLIFRTDLAADKLPIGSDGRVDEGGTGIVKVFDSGANVDAGKSTTFHTALSAGHYVLVCNLPGHYAGGMHTAFTVN
jgi:uncharacterized cupredoxin-like copper-binding protein